MQWIRQNGRSLCSDDVSLCKSITVYQCIHVSPQFNIHVCIDIVRILASKDFPSVFRIQGDDVSCVVVYLTYSVDSARYFTIRTMH